MNAQVVPVPTASRADAMRAVIATIPLPVRAFDEHDAASNAADRLHKDGDVGELVEDLAESADWLHWLAGRVDLPAGAREAMKRLIQHADRVKRTWADECRLLGVDP